MSTSTFSPPLPPAPCRMRDETGPRWGGSGRVGGVLGGFLFNWLSRSRRDARFSFSYARSGGGLGSFLSGGLGRERKVVGSFPFGVSPRLNQRKRKKKSDDSPAARAMGESCETRPPFVQINRFPHRARRGVLGSASPYPTRGWDFHPAPVGASCDTRPSLAKLFRYSASPMRTKVNRQNRFGDFRIHPTPDFCLSPIRSDERLLSPLMSACIL